MDIGGNGENVQIIWLDKENCIQSKEEEESDLCALICNIYEGMQHAANFMVK